LLIYFSENQIDYPRKNYAYSKIYLFNNLQKPSHFILLEILLPTSLKNKLNLFEVSCLSEIMILSLFFILVIGLLTLVDVLVASLIKDPTFFLSLLFDSNSLWY